MNIQEAHLSDAPMIASVLQEAAQWLVSDGRALWSAAEISHERVLRDTNAGLFHVARDGEQLAGVMKFELEDANFWPEVQRGPRLLFTSSPYVARGRRRESRPSCFHTPELEPNGWDVLSSA